MKHTCHVLLIHVLVNGQLNCFHILMRVDIVPLCMLYRYLWVSAKFLEGGEERGRAPRWNCWIVWFSLIFWKLPSYFSLFPSAMHRGSGFFTSSPTIFLCFCVLFCLFSLKHPEVSCHLTGFNVHFPMMHFSRILNILLYEFTICVFSLLNYLLLCPILGVFCWVARVLYVFWLLMPYQLHILLIIHPFWRLPFHSVGCILWYTKVLNLDDIHGMFFSFCLPFIVCSKGGKKFFVFFLNENEMCNWKGRMKGYHVQQLVPEQWEGHYLDLSAGGHLCWVGEGELGRHQELRSPCLVLSPVKPSGALGNAVISGRGHWLNFAAAHTAL